MKKNIYLLLTMLGLLFLYYFIFQFYLTDSTPTFQAIANLFMCVLTAWVFMYFEGKRIQMKKWWTFIPATFIGLSFALPLFLYFRESHIEK